MSNNVKTVTLTPTPDGQWHAVQPVKLPPNSGEWLISFQLTGANAKDVTFDSTDPIWVRADQKPDSNNNEHPQIAAEVVSGDGKSLVILDRNSNDSDAGTLELHYVLNFNGYADLDPIIENGGGPKAISYPGFGLIDSTGALAIALLIAAAIGFGLALISRR